VAVAEEAGEGEVAALVEGAGEDRMHPLRV